MIWNIILFIIFVVWVIMYVKNKKTILALPYLLMLFLTPFYNILDQKFFVEVFGCGCVPSAQTNMFNISFNANNLRFVVYSVFTAIMLIIGIVLSKKLNSKVLKAIYPITILILNLLFTYKICQMYMWD